MCLIIWRWNQDAGRSNLGHYNLGALKPDTILVHGHESNDGQRLLLCLPLYLCHLLRDCFAHNAKDSTFARRFEINRSWPHGVTQNMNLLCKVK